MELPWKKTAEEEYALDPKLKKEDVETLRQWMRDSPHLPEVDDEMICQFLYACFYEVEQTKKTMDYYYTYKTTMPDFFDNWDPTTKEMQDIVNNVMVAAALPGPDKDGYRVILCRLNNTSPELFNYPLCVKWMLMSCTCSIWNQGIQPGYVIVYDSTGYSMSHLFRCSLTNVRNYINYGKNASPVRVVKIVFINTSPVVKKLISLVKPFLSKDLINMMAFYTDPEEYFSTLPKSIIPEDYGGEAPSSLSLHNLYAKEVMKAKDYLLAEEKLRAETTKKNGKASKESTKLEASFHKLEID